MKKGFGFIILILILGLILYFIFASPNFTAFLKSSPNASSSDNVVVNGTSGISFGLKSPTQNNAPRLGPTPHSPYYEKKYGSISGGRIISNIGTNTGSTNNNPINVINPPEGFAQNELSPYYGKITIAAINFSSIYSPYNRVAIASKTNDLINVSGWRIQNKWGSLPNIPQAIADYQPFGINAKTDIIIKAGETVNMYSNRSASNQNFRLNKCTGYFNNYYNFQPVLPKSCPALDKGDSYLFSSSCQNFVRSISGCRVPTANELNRFSLPGDNLCHAFLDKINYGGCYQEHSTDANFFSKEWRVWLGQNFDFDRRNDRLFLFDENNLLVDEYVY
ncbi:MAG: hypothetical protein Q8L36_01455 [bacterium]|nr:hypothetical protein [bacterium]